MLKKYLLEQVKKIKPGNKKARSLQSRYLSPKMWIIVDH